MMKKLPHSQASYQKCWNTSFIPMDFQNNCIAKILAHWTCIKIKQMTSLWKNGLKDKAKTLSASTTIPTRLRLVIKPQAAWDPSLCFSAIQQNKKTSLVYHIFKKLESRLDKTLIQIFLLPLEPVWAWGFLSMRGPTLWANHGPVVEVSLHMFCVLFNSLLNMLKCIFLSCPQTHHEKYTRSLVVIAISHTVGRVLAALLWVNS